MKNLNGKIAVVTGAGSGIGRALALQLAQEGCHLALGDIDTAGLDETKALLKDFSVNVSLHNVNVADCDRMTAFAQEVIDHHRAVNLVFNNAGVAYGTSVEDATYTDMHWLMNINLWGVIHGCKAFLPFLKQAEQGHIVNLASVFGLMSLPGQSIYNASKFAVRGFTDSLRQEMAGSTVGVSCAFPAGIKTAIARNARITSPQGVQVDVEQEAKKIEKFFLTTPEQAASEIIAGVKKSKARILVGKGSGVIDFVTRLLPVGYSRFLNFS